MREVVAQVFVEGAHEDDEVNPERSEPVAELYDVQTALPSLDLAHRRLRTCQQMSEIRLTDLMSVAMLSQERQEHLVLLGV